MIFLIAGRAGTGKTTLAGELVKALTPGNLPEHGIAVWFDSDTIRQTVSHGLGYNTKDRERNLRQALQVAADLDRHNNNVVLSLCASIDRPRLAFKANLGNRLIDCLCKDELISRPEAWYHPQSTKHFDLEFTRDQPVAERLALIMALAKERTPVRRSREQGAG